MEQNSIGTDCRIFYSRTGAARYISHLDVNRTMQRAVARAHLPVWYTQGFNPHIYLTFALPTPLGYESTCETMDLRLVQEISMEELCAAMNACLPQGIRVLHAAPPVHSPDVIEKADYEVAISAPGKTGAELLALWESLYQMQTIPVQKRTKKGSKEVNLKPLMQCLAKKAEGEDLRLVLRLACGSTLNINPGLVFEAFSALLQLKTDCVRVKKLAVYTNNQQKDELFA